MEDPPNDDRLLAFKVRAPLGAHGQEVLSAFKRVAPGRVRGAQPRGYGFYEVIMNDLVGTRLIREAGMVQIKGKEVPVQYLGAKTRKVSVFRYPIDYPDTDLERALAGYGTVLKLTRERYSGEHSDCETGTRIVMMELVSDLPNFLTVRGVRIECLYYGVTRRCAKCNEIGHAARGCPAQKCRWCDSMFVGSCRKCEEQRERIRRARNIPKDVDYSAWGQGLDDGWFRANEQEFPALEGEKQRKEKETQESEQEMRETNGTQQVAENAVSVENNEEQENAEGNEEITAEYSEKGMENVREQENVKENEQETDCEKESAEVTADSDGTDEEEGDDVTEDSDTSSDTVITTPESQAGSYTSTSEDADVQEASGRESVLEGKEETPKRGTSPRRVTRASARKNRQEKGAT